MKKMNNKFKKYRKGIITIEVQSQIPQRFVNLLWNNGIIVQNIKVKNITTLTMNVKLCDYNEIDAAAKKAGAKIKIIDRKGIDFFILKMRKRIAFVIGIILFIYAIHYLSTYVWKVEIITENNVSPYELRQQLKTLGIKPGIKKKDLDVYKLQDKIIEINDEVMWVKARLEGSKLRVDIAERQNPPKILQDDTTGNLVASKNGVVVRVYTTKGTAIVKPEAIVEKGEILVKGEQGIEEKVYEVKAEGDVIAKTFYEEITEAPIKQVERKRTGNIFSRNYITIKGKKIYFKKNANKFSKYDKIEDNNKFLKKEIYYEVKEKTLDTDTDKIIEELREKIKMDLDKSTKIVDEIKEVKKLGEKYKIRLMLITEENIAVNEK